MSQHKKNFPVLTPDFYVYSIQGLIAYAEDKIKEQGLNEKRYSGTHVQNYSQSMATAIQNSRPAIWLPKKYGPRALKIPMCSARMKLCWQMWRMI